MPSAKQRRSTETKVLTPIQTNEARWVFTPADFADLGAQASARAMATEGKLGGLIIYAIDFLGTNLADEVMIARLREKLSADEPVCGKDEGWWRGSWPRRRRVNRHVGQEIMRRDR
jgi:hypothetical protein